MLGRTLAGLLHGERWRARWQLRGHTPLDLAGDHERVYAIGVVRPLEETLVAPLSGRACVAYRSRLTLSLNPFLETKQVRPFVLDLGEEEIVVAGEHAIFGVPPLAPAALDRERKASFLARHATRSGRFQEIVLELGARVAVGGTLVLVPSDDPPIEGELGFRDPPPPERRIVGARRRPLVFVDVERW